MLSGGTSRHVLLTCSEKPRRTLSTARARGSTLVRPGGGIHLIEALGLEKRYGDLVAIQDVSFRVEKGEIVGFLGPNAAGKTTTMRILTGFMPPTAGSARIAGYDVTEQSVEARRHVGYLPENVPLYNEMTVRGYLAFMAQLRGVPRRQVPSRVAEVIDAVRIGDRADAIIGKLSRGYRQRVGLAQAMVHNPDVLILDEPTVGLDPAQVIEVRQLIKSLGGSRTVILSTHILPEASAVCGRILIINEGRLVAADTPENLTRRLRSSQQVRLQVRGPRDEVCATLANVDGVAHVEVGSTRDGVTSFTLDAEPEKDVREAVARAVVAVGWGLLELQAVDMSLEEVFLKLTQEEEQAQAEGRA